MPKQRLLLVSYIALLIGTMTSACLSALAQTAPDPCDAYAIVTVPEADRPTIAEARSAGEGCSALGIYYYENVPDKFRKARYCALAKLGLFRADVSSADAQRAQSFAAGGATFPADLGTEDGLTLAMLWERGEGVQRNLQVAAKFACDYYAPPPYSSEDMTKGQIAFVASVKQGKPFQVCENDGSRFERSADYACLSFAVGKKERQIVRKQADVNALLQGTLKSSFAALEAAWQHFHETDLKADTAGCGGGTGCGLFLLQYDLDEDSQWVAALSSLAGGTPPFTPAQLGQHVELDEKLNGLYQGNLTDEACSDAPCSVSKTREAERAWLIYREAWVKFGALRWPDIPADQWRTWLTTLRVRQFSS